VVTAKDGALLGVMGVSRSPDREDGTSPSPSLELFIDIGRLRRPGAVRIGDPITSLGLETFGDGLAVSNAFDKMGA
jgi:hypothetical protein